MGKAAPDRLIQCELYLWVEAFENLACPSLKPLSILMVVTTFLSSLIPLVCLDEWCHNLNHRDFVHRFFQ